MSDLALAALPAAVAVRLTLAARTTVPPSAVRQVALLGRTTVDVVQAVAGHDPPRFAASIVKTLTRRDAVGTTV